MGFVMLAWVLHFETVAQCDAVGQRRSSVAALGGDVPMASRYISTGGALGLDVCCLGPFSTELGVFFAIRAN